jgi:hypothetical protein
LALTDFGFIFNLFVLLAVVVAGGIAVRLLAPIIAQHFKGSVHGWSRLSSRYATTQQPPTQAVSRQTLVVGQVLYRNCVTVGLSDAGLYLKIGFPLSIFGKSSLLIPWSEFKQISEARLYLHKAACLSLGDPPVGTITVPMTLFEMMRRSLPPRLQDGFAATSGTAAS